MGLTEEREKTAKRREAMDHRVRAKQKEATMMKTNEGLADRVIRVTVGLGVLSLLAVGAVPGWGLIGFIGAIPLVTGLVGFCPTYTLLGIDTTAGVRRQAEGR